MNVSSHQTFSWQRKTLQAIAWATRRAKLPGRERLLWLICNPDNYQAKHFNYTIKYEHSLLVHVDISQLLDWTLFFFGEHDPGVARVIKQLFRPGFVAFDVGANIGCYALVMGFLAKETGRVFAFEPFPRIFEKLKENITLNRLKNIKIFSFALSDIAGRLPFYVPVEAAVNQGESSFYEENVTYDHREIQVETRTLDEVIMAEGCARVDFIKIDVEGHEYKVLLGGKESIRKYRPYIVFEYEERTWKNAGYDFKAAKDFFLEMNYALFVVKPKRFAKIENNLPAFTNILAVP